MNWRIHKVDAFAYYLRSDAGEVVHAPTKETASALRDLLNARDQKIERLERELHELKSTRERNSSVIESDCSTRP